MRNLETCPTLHDPPIDGKIKIAKQRAKTGTRYPHPLSKPSERQVEPKSLFFVLLNIFFVALEQKNR